MSLATELEALKSRAKAELVAARTYHHETRFAWMTVDYVAQTIKPSFSFWAPGLEGGTFAIDVEELAERSRPYRVEQLNESSFQSFLSIFEAFLFDFLALWLTAYPQHLFSRTVAFRAIYEAPDKDAVTAQVVERELNELLYKRPEEWFVYLNQRVNLDCPSADEVGRYAEAKACRDALVHNRGVVTERYKGKAGVHARFEPGQRVEISDETLDATWQLLHDMVGTLSDAATRKASTAT